MIASPVSRLSRSSRYWHDLSLRLIPSRRLALFLSLASRDIPIAHVQSDCNGHHTLLLDLRDCRDATTVWSMGRKSDLTSLEEEGGYGSSQTTDNPTICPIGPSPPTYSQTFP